MAAAFGAAPRTVGAIVATPRPNSAQPASAAPMPGPATASSAPVAASTAAVPRAPEPERPPAGERGPEAGAGARGQRARRGEHCGGPDDARAAVARDEPVAGEPAGREREGVDHERGGGQPGRGPALGAQL